VPPVDPNTAVCHDPIELNEDVTAGELGRQVEVLSIPGDAGWEESSRTPSWRVGIERSGYGPVVGNINAAPAAVVGRRLFGALDVSAHESPGTVERGLNPGAGLRDADRPADQCHGRRDPFHSNSPRNRIRALSSLRSTLIEYARL
jgi:hypothetical protein